MAEAKSEVSRTMSEAERRHLDAMQFQRQEAHREALQLEEKGADEVQQLTVLDMKTETKRHVAQIETMYRQQLEQITADREHM